MTPTRQQTVPSLQTALLRDGRFTAGPVLSLHGEDPTTGIPATWHILSFAGDDAAETFLVERAEGDIHSPALWMQAQREAAIVSEAEVIELVRSVMFR